MAGGEGSRLRPLTLGRPKPLVPILNVPVLQHIFGLLRRHGITEIVVTVQYLGNLIQDYFGEGQDFGVSITYSIEESPLGTAGSVRNAADLLTEPFLVISGDALTDFDLRAPIAFHKRQQAMATLVLHRVPNPLEYGVVILGEDNRVTQFLEKPSWGEVFSDTVNTGMYVLDPEIFRYVPKDKMVDWSQDVFPQLLQNGDPMVGYVAEGYWRDIGDLGEYMRSNADMLHGQASLDVSGVVQERNLWITPDSRPSIDPSAQLYGPVYLGKNVEIREDTVVHGPTVIGDYTIVEPRAHIDRSVIWANCYLGAGTNLHGALIGRQCLLKNGAAVFEGAVVGDGCTLGEGAIIRPKVKLWPDKVVDDGATVSQSIIWGQQGRRTIFGSSGVTGLSNVELVPEFAARLGAAYGSTLPIGARVTVNRDLSRPARMLKRALISGLPSAAVDVLDIGSQPIPVARYETQQSAVAGGIHVRTSPHDRRMVDIKILGSDGLNSPKSAERKVETVFFREDFRRVPPEEIGSITVIGDPVALRYRQAFRRHVEQEVLGRSGGRLVLDYGLGTASAILQPLLATLGVDSIPINAATGQPLSVRSLPDVERDRRQLAQITATVGATFGGLFDHDGKTVTLVDEHGQELVGMTALAAFAVLVWRTMPGATVGVPVTAPLIFERLAKKLGGHVRRTRATPDALMTAGAVTEPPDFLGDGQGGYIFPEFHPGFDAMMASVRLLQCLTQEGVSLSEVIAALPPFHMGHVEVESPWESKGKVMRALHQRAREQNRNREVAQIDGVRFDLDDQWSLVLPDPDRPLFRIYTEAPSSQQASVLADEYAELVRRLA